MRSRPVHSEARPPALFPLWILAARLYLPGVSRKSAAIAALIENCRGRELDAHYHAYFECFNRRLFFEAHDVLEELWLEQRHTPKDQFYKGLIQLAGAFVHLQKNRLRPAVALFKLAQSNLGRYPAVQDALDLAGVLSLIGEWIALIEDGGYAVNPLRPEESPRLALLTRMMPN